MSEILFYLTGIICIATAILAITSKEVIHAIIYLAGLFVGIGLVYLLLGVPFLGAIQVLIYVGGVVAMMLFAIMLVRTSDSPQEVEKDKKISYMLSVITLLALMVTLSVRLDIGKSEPIGFNTLQISELLFGKYLISFEVLGLLLTAVAVGTIVMAMKENTGADA